MRLSQWTLALTLGAAGAFGVSTFAQDSKTGALDSKQDAAQDAGDFQMPPEFAPGANHKLLDAFAGEWKATVKFWMEPGTEPSESTGSSTATWVLDGRWLQEKFQGDFGGMPFHGVATTGYDPFKKMFISTWIDSMSTTMMIMEGTADSGGKVFTYTAKAFDPFLNMELTTRTIISVESHDQHTMKMYTVMPDGAEFQSMEIVYTRTK